MLMQDSYISDEAMLQQIALADDEAGSYYADRPTGLVGDPRSVAGRPPSDPGVRRTWSGLGGFPGKAMLSKFGSPARTRRPVRLKANKGELQNVPNAIPNVVSALNRHQEEEQDAVAADDVASKL